MRAQYAQWLPLALAARHLGYSRTAFLLGAPAPRITLALRSLSAAARALGTWFVLGVITVLYMRQTLLDVRWWQAVGVAGALMAFFARELALPANAFWLFFAQYVVGATAATALLARLLPEHLLSEMPVRGAAESGARGPAHRSRLSALSRSQEVLFRTGILRHPSLERAAEPRRARAKAS